MIRQYIAFALVLLVAVFVFTQIDWNRVPVQVFNPMDDAPVAATAEKMSSGGTDVSFGDLRVGGVSGASSRQKPDTVFSSPPRFSQDTAASSSPFSATSTPFQAGSGTPRVYSGVDVQFSKAGKSAKKIGLENGAVVDNKPAAASNSPENLSTRISISGHVVDDNGEPISGLALTLKLRQASTEDKLRYGKRTLTAQSGDEGAYSFVNLVAGEYQLCTLEVNGYKAVCQNPRAPHSSADFSLHNTLAGRVFGSVRDEQGKLLSEVIVSATPGQKNRASSDKKGEFRLQMKVSAELNYQLYFGKEQYTRERVSVKGRDILAGKQLDIVLKKTQYSGFDVQGTVYDQSGAPLSGRTVTLHSPTAKSALALRAASGPSGEFTIKYVAAADDYRLSVNTGGGYTFDASSYTSMEIFDGMAPLNIQLQSAGSGSLRAYIVSSNGTPIKGETFSLYSGSAFVGRSVSDAGGEIRFDNVPVTAGGSALRISGGSVPKYTFSGMTLVESEHKSAIELVVDRGDNKLVLTVKDESQNPLQGARGVLIWSQSRNGVRSQTMRSRGKISMAGTGIINFSELGQGEHQLQVSLEGYLPYSTLIDISQQTQREDAVLVKAEGEPG